MTSPPMVEVEHPPYRYTGFTAASLSSKPIRLLQLRPGDTKEDLKNALFPARLDAPLPSSPPSMRPCRTSKARTPTLALPSPSTATACSRSARPWPRPSSICGTATGRGTSGSTPSASTRATSRSKPSRSARWAPFAARRQGHPRLRLTRVSGPRRLRPTSAVDETLDDHRDTFFLVGPAYMDGIMDGEALLGSLPAGYAVQWRVCPSEQGSTPVFSNTLTGEMCRGDPRVDPDGEPSTTQQEVSGRYWALTPPRLRERGVDIKEVDIV